MTDFLIDFVNYAKEQSLAISILSDYHIVLDHLELLPDGSFKKLPEVVNQILAHLDALETFLYR
jgi:hypothetical protein